MYGADEIDRALKEYNAMELFQAKEMVRRTARGETAMYEALEFARPSVCVCKTEQVSGVLG